MTYYLQRKINLQSTVKMKYMYLAKITKRKNEIKNTRNNTENNKISKLITYQNT